MSTNNATVNSSEVNNDILSDILVALGVVGTLLNSIFLLALLKDVQLRQNCLLLIGLTIGHVLSGIECIIYGNLKYILPLSDYAEPATAWYCITVIYPSLLVFVYQLLPLFLILIGIERLLALGAPVWFIVHWKPRRRLIATVVPFAFCFTLMLVQTIKAYFTPGFVTTKSCSVAQLFGQSYLAYGVHAPSILGGLSAGVCNFCAVCFGRRRLRKMPQTSPSEIARANAQIRLAKCMFAIACVDIFCVVIPNVDLFLLNIGATTSSEYVFVYAILFSLDSSLNVFVYLVLSKDFRKAVLNLFSFKKNVSIVHAIEDIIVARTTL